MGAMGPDDVWTERGEPDGRRVAGVPSGETSSLRVLLLDDSNDDADLLLRRLRKGGYVVDSIRVDTAANFRHALADGTWDVILADYSMPQFTAPDALVIVKELHVDVPFIIVSGSVGEAAAVEVMKAGAHDFFLKDNLTRLTSAIERERAEARVRQERREAIRELRESQERLRHAVRARDEFLSIASHELKTPLTSLTLQADSALRLLDDPLASDGEREKLKAKVAGFSQHLVRMTSLINNLLEVTRITSGRLTLAPETFDLREAVDASVAALRDSVRRSGSSVSVVTSAPVMGRWDRLGIESVTTNLLSNALKYGEGRPVELEVDLEQQKARLVITDHGVGIPASDRERIFHRFERAVPERHFGGFGLGLWVARQIIEAHGGTITVASKPNIGSIFTVLLPCEPQERIA